MMQSKWTAMTWFAEWAYEYECLFGIWNNENAAKWTQWRIFFVCVQADLVNWKTLQALRVKKRSS